MRAPGRFAVLFAGTIGLGACGEEAAAPSPGPEVADPPELVQPTREPTDEPLAEPSAEPSVADVEPVVPDEVETDEDPDEDAPPSNEQRDVVVRRRVRPVRPPVPAYGGPRPNDPSLVGAYGGPSRGGFDDL